MARTKLIAKYTPLDTPDLPAKIYDILTQYIQDHGIENLPALELNGRWTGRLSISNGGWRGDFDFLYPVLSMCRIDRHGIVTADMEKIEKRVADWRDYLHTPDENDIYIGADDEHFKDSDYLSDDENEFRSAAYRAEFDSFMNDDSANILSYDKALSDIDSMFLPVEPDYATHSEEDGKLFKEGFSVQRIDNYEDYKKLMAALQKEAEEGGGIAWSNTDMDDDEMEEFFARQAEQPSWMEFIDDLRNGRYGELPEDYDGLAEEEPEEE